MAIDVSELHRINSSVNGFYRLLKAVKCSVKANTACIDEEVFPIVSHPDMNRLFLTAYENQQSIAAQ